MAKFQYRERTSDDWEKRTNQSSGAFQHFIKDEYRLYTPQKGENCVRIMPPSSLWENAPHYGLDVHVHYGVGPENAQVICLELGAPQIGISGKPCPVCAEHKKLLRANDTDAARELRPVKRVVTAVLDRKDEAKGVLIWAMPYTLDQMIAKASRNRSTGGWYLIDRPQDGFDIYFERTGEQLTTKYQYAERADRPSPVADRYLDWVEQNPIPEVLKWRDYDEVARLFAGLSRAEEADAETRPYRRGDRDEEERAPRQRDRDPEPSPRERSMRDRDRGREQDDRDEESLERDREHLDRVTRGKTMDNYDRGEARRRQEREEDEAPPARQESPPREREPVRRPTAASTSNGGNGNGRDREQPADDRPSSQGKDRAAQLRSRFVSREQR